jgi:hypothetical protein
MKVSPQRKHFPGSFLATNGRLVSLSGVSNLGLKNSYPIRWSLEVSLLGRSGQFENWKSAFFSPRDAANDDLYVRRSVNPLNEMFDSIPQLEKISFAFCCPNGK